MLMNLAKIAGEEMLSGSIHRPGEGTFKVSILIDYNYNLMHVQHAAHGNKAGYMYYYCRQSMIDCTMNKSHT